MYVAKCHVRLKDYTARPGEVFEDALDEQTLRRLVQLGAVEEVPIPGKVQSEGGENLGGAAGFPQSPPETGDGAVDEEGTGEPVPDGNVEEPVPPPVIDAMDGISAGKKGKGKKG